MASIVQFMVTALRFLTAPTIPSPRQQHMLNHHEYKQRNLAQEESSKTLPITAVYQSSRPTHLFASTLKTKSFVNLATRPYAR